MNIAMTVFSVNYWEQLFTSSSLMSFPTITSISKLMKSLSLWQYWKTYKNYLVTSFPSIHKHQLDSQWDIISHHLKIAVLELGNRITLLITLNKDLVRATEHFRFSQRYGIQQFQSLQDLDRLIELGHDRQLWKHLWNDIFEAAQADWSPDHETRENYYY